MVHTQRQGKRTFYFLPLELALRGKARGLFDICAMKALWGSLRDTRHDKRNTYFVDRRLTLWHGLLCRQTLDQEDTAPLDFSIAPRPAPGDRGRGVQGQLDAEVWEEINASCIEHQEFWLAQICALHVIVLPDELEELIGSYE